MTTLCLNPNCLAENPENQKFCSQCGSKLLLENRYRAVKYIGRGGFGTTFLAVDEQRLNSYCVVKQFLPIQQGSITPQKASELFKEEAIRLSELGKHSQIPDLFAFFELELRENQQKYWFLVQEFIDGENLVQEIQKKGRLTENEVKQFLLDLLPVIQFIHEKKVIHKDIKPENIIRRQDGSLVLIDFGISKQLTHTVMSGLSPMTIRAFSPFYASPEQLRGQIHYTSDLYSLAVTAIRLLTGYIPIDQDELYDIYTNKWQWQEYLKNQDIIVNQDLAQILNKMLENDLINRFQSAQEVLNTINDLSLTIPKPIKLNGKWGYISDGKVLVFPKFDDAGDLSEGLAEIKQNNKYGFINSKGEIIITPQFDYVANFSEGLAGIKKDDKWGFINSKGEIIITPQFDYVANFSEGLAGIKKDDKWGFINSKEEIIISFNFDNIGIFSEGLAGIKKDSKYGFINTKGEIIIRPQFDEFVTFQEGLAKVKKDDKWGVINTKGEIVITPQFDRIYIFKEGLAPVTKDGKWGFINNKGEIIIHPQFNGFWIDLYYASNPFKEGFVQVRKDGKYGFINNKGEIITPQFDEADDFSEGFASVAKDNQWGFINTKGEIVIPFQFLAAHEFSGGLALVITDEECGFINTKGEFVISLNDFDYDFDFFWDYFNFSEGFFQVEKDGKWGFINTKGEIVIPFQYDKAKSFEEGLAIVEISGIEYLIDKTGKIVC